MKRKITAVFSALVAVLITCTVFISGCFDSAPKEYTIQYTDDLGTHLISVNYGMPYSMEEVPAKTGYDFIGLFDAEVGGTQYVNSSGSSLAPFTNKKNMVLFPQYKAKDYTVILDYQGATVTGERQLTVTYGNSLPELPKNLTAEHSEFIGWFTHENCGGTQISDKYGLVPVVSTLNENNFDLSGDYVYIFAGFEAEKHTVTFVFETGMDNEEIQVPYNTPISDVVPDTRVNGNAVQTWSKTQDGEVFNGKVTSDMVLYAIEYAPIIEFDSNGGNVVKPIVARAGSTIALPTPTKDLAKFSYWEDMKGNVFEEMIMPFTSISLKAVWQAKIVFYSNGGSDVDDISVETGTTITLPTPEREDYIFAGWFTESKEQYTSTTMPAAGIALKAGWYKVNEKLLTLIDNNTDNKLVVDSNTLSAKYRLKIDLSEEISVIPTDGLEINFEITFYWGNTYKYVKADGQVALYEGDEFNTDYQLAKKSLSHNDQWDHYLEDNLTGTATIHKNILYFYYAGYGQLKITLTGGYGDDVAFYNIKVKITYPDTTKLYL